MSRIYSHTLTVDLGAAEDPREFETTVQYGVAWGTPESGNYGPPEDYDPGSGDAVECISIDRVNGAMTFDVDGNLCVNLLMEIENDQGLIAELLEAAAHEDERRGE